MVTYSYTGVVLPVGGYVWNLLARCYYTFGVWPAGTAFLPDGSFIVQFAQDLTAAQKSQLDTWMAGAPFNPPATTNTVFVIEDLWERLEKFNAANNQNFHLYYSSDGAGGVGVLDNIELHAQKVMTNNEKNQVINRFTQLITVR